MLVQMFSVNSKKIMTFWQFWEKKKKKKRPIKVPQ